MFKRPNYYDYVAYDIDGALLFKTFIDFVTIFKDKNTSEWMMEIFNPEVVYIIRNIKNIDGRELINGYKLDLNNMSIEGKLSNYEKAGIKVQKENL